MTTAAAAESTAEGVSSAGNSNKTDRKEDDEDEVEPLTAVAQVESVLNKCVAAAPNKGEVWCSIAKQTHLRRADAGTVLKTVVEALLSSTTPPNRLAQTSSAAATGVPTTSK